MRESTDSTQGEARHAEPDSRSPASSHRAFIIPQTEEGRILTLVTVSRIELGTEDPPSEERVIEVLAEALKDAGWFQVETHILRTVDYPRSA
jgi:hypothetical protein